LDYLESNLRKIRTLRILQTVVKNGFAPRAALLTALWGDEPCRKAPTLLVFGSGAYVHRSTVGSLVFDFSLLSRSSVVERMGVSLPHTVFSSSLSLVSGTPKCQESA
jgi:hypothetical protein